MMINVGVLYNYINWMFCNIFKSIKIVYFIHIFTNVT